jgi:hypothetical protein
MGRAHSFWNKLSGWQQFIAVSVAATILGWPFGKGLDWLSANFIWLAFLAVVAQALIGFATNPIVVAFMTGAILAGFGPALWAYLRKVGAGNIAGKVAGLVVSASILATFYIILSVIYSTIFESPTRYVPPTSALKNHDGSLRVFTKWKIRDFNRPFSDYTQVAAKQKIADETGKWIALTGLVSEIEPDTLDSGYRVSVSSKLSGLAVMGFESSWSKKILAFNKGDRIYAVCKIETADSMNIYLQGCELAHP